MIHILSKYGKSKKNCDVDLDENMISNIDTKRLMKLKMKKILRKHKLTKMKQTIKK